MHTTLIELSTLYLVFSCMHGYTYTLISDLGQLVAEPNFSRSLVVKEKDIQR